MEKNLASHTYRNWSLTGIGECHNKCRGLRSVLHSSGAANACVIIEPVDILVPHTDRSIGIGCVRGIDTFRSNFENDVATIGFIPKAEVLKTPEMPKSVVLHLSYLRNIERLLCGDFRTFSSEWSTDDSENNEGNRWEKHLEWCEWPVDGALSYL